MFNKKLKSKPNQIYFYRLTFTDGSTYIGQSTDIHKRIKSYKNPKLSLRNQKRLYDRLKKDIDFKYDIIKSIDYDPLRYTDFIDLEYDLIQKEYQIHFSNGEPLKLLNILTRLGSYNK